MKNNNIYTKEELDWLNTDNMGTLPTRLTPSEINVLSQNEVFVFGSNVQGMHTIGAARVAYNEFGAEWGNGEGLQGQSYAIPTMEGEDSIRAAIKRFIEFANNHPELKFLVTPIGCGVAGYTSEEIAPIFKSATDLKNVYLPISFWKILLKIECNDDID